MEHHAELPEALRQCEERFHRVLSGSDKLAIQGYTIDGIITFWNRASEILYGYTVDDAVGKNILDLLHTEETRGEEQALMDEILRTGNLPPPSEMQICTASGKSVWIYCNRMLVRQPGRPPEFFCFDIDVTEHKQAELALQTMQRLESLGVLAGGIAHDFNNVLTGIFGNMELALRHINPEDPAAKHLNTASLALDRAVSLTQQLLTFAKGDAPIMGEVALCALLQETAGFNLCGSNITLQCNIQPDLWRIIGDRSQMERVLANLIINARDAMPDGGTLRINADNIVVDQPAAHGVTLPTTPRPCVRIVIQDEGCGIAEEAISRIFEPYFSTKQTGHGLGLSIVHSIVTKHGGHIDVTSRPAGGTAFTIELPVACIPQGDRKPECTSYTWSKASSQPESGIHILAMDDDDLIRAFIEAALTTLGHQVTTVSSGDEAVECYRTALQAGQPYDIAILDLTIRGGMGGLTTAGHLLALDPSARLIVASGYSQDGALADYRQHGFLGQLTKPFQLSELESEIERVMA